MCPPVIAGVTAAAKGVTATQIALASAATSFIGQQQAASAQAKAQEQAAAAEQLRSQRANTATRVREGQEGTARSQRKEATQLQSMEAQARARLVALTEAGVGGQSLRQVTANLKAKEARYNYSEQQQKELQQQQTTFGFEEEALRSQMNQLRINQPIQKANLMSSALSGLQTGMAFKQATS